MQKQADDDVMIKMTFREEEEEEERKGLERRRQQRHLQDNNLTDFYQSVTPTQACLKF